MLGENISIESNEVGKALAHLTRPVGQIVQRAFVPVATELGVLAAEKVRQFREANAKRFEKKLLQKSHGRALELGARALAEGLEAATWSDEDEVQELWAGLLSSGVAGDAGDQQVLGYVRTLREMTAPECRLMAAACEHVAKVPLMDGLVVPSDLNCSIETARRVARVDDVHLLDMHLDRMRSLGVGSEDCGIARPGPDDEPVVLLSPSAWALGMYVRCMGSKASPMDYFKVPARADGHSRTDDEREQRRWLSVSAIRPDGTLALATEPLGWHAFRPPNRSTVDAGQSATGKTK